MTPADSDSSFIDFCRSAGIAIELAVPSSGIDAMIRFYREVRSEAKLDEYDSDMLLYQWGVHSFSEPASFHLNISRQFTELLIEDGEEFPEMSQLQLTFHFPASDMNKSFEHGNEWCSSSKEIPDFQAFIRNSGPFIALGELKADRVEILWDLI